MNQQTLTRLVLYISTDICLYLPDYFKFCERNMTQMKLRTKSTKEETEQDDISVLNSIYYDDYDFLLLL